MTISYIHAQACANDFGLDYNKFCSALRKYVAVAAPPAEAGGAMVPLSEVLNFIDLLARDGKGLRHEYVESRSGSLVRVPDFHASVRAAAPAAPAPDTAGEGVRKIGTITGTYSPEYSMALLPIADAPIGTDLYTQAPRVTGGREWDEAEVERAARFICATCGEDWDSIGDFARSVLIENQRGALQAATGGEGES